MCYTSDFFITFFDRCVVAIVISIKCDFMKREEFIQTVKCAVGIYIDNTESYDSDPQVRINPANLAVDLVNGSDLLKAIEYSDEAVESAAGAEGDASESATDYQALQDPDFYAVRRLVRRAPDGTCSVDMVAVDSLADTYFK